MRCDLVIPPVSDTAMKSDPEDSKHTYRYIPVIFMGICLPVRVCGFRWMCLVAHLWVQHQNQLLKSVVDRGF